MNIYSFTVPTARGEAQSVKDYSGSVLLIVNTASRCGFTPQYEGLERLYEKYKDRGFHVLAFPCNQFGFQEPGTNDEIQEFCQVHFGVTFPVMGKIDVNGPNAHPLFAYLKQVRSGLFGTKTIKWNFTKFLVNASGVPVARYSPNTKPEKLEGQIEKLLSQLKTR